MDTTYFGREYGIMVFADSRTQQILFIKTVEYETNQHYLAGIQYLKSQHIEIQSIICDGRRGLTTLLPDIPVQLCQFHQVQCIIHYLSRHPKDPAPKALLALTYRMKNCTEKEFKQGLKQWYQQHKEYLNERSINLETGKTWYTHKRLRTAYFSLKRNIPLLFQFEQYSELNIPKTTNYLEGLFGDLKNKLRCHQGLKKERKIKFIQDYLMSKNDF